MKSLYKLSGVLLLGAVLVITVALYSRLPDRLPTHWNYQGAVDQYGPRWTVWILPGVMAAILISFWWVLPWLSPRRFEVETFLPTYGFIMLVLLALTGYLQAMILSSSLGLTRQMERAVPGGIFLFMLLLGNVLGKVRRNFWIGIRTPWTLADERVWNATHRFAGWMFVLAGFFGLLVVLSGWPLVIAFVALMASVAATVLYSLYYYKRLQRRGEV